MRETHLAKALKQSPKSAFYLFHQSVLWPFKNILNNLIYRLNYGIFFFQKCLRDKFMSVILVSWLQKAKLYLDTPEHYSSFVGKLSVFVLNLLSYKLLQMRDKHGNGRKHLLLYNRLMAQTLKSSEENPCREHIPPSLISRKAIQFCYAFEGFSLHIYNTLYSKIEWTDCFVYESNIPFTLWMKSKLKFSSSVYVN